MRRGSLKKTNQTWNVSVYIVDSKQSRNNEKTIIKQVEIALNRRHIFNKLIGNSDTFSLGIKKFLAIFSTKLKKVDTYFLQNGRMSSIYCVASERERKFDIIFVKIGEN